MGVVAVTPLPQPSRFPSERAQAKNSLCLGGALRLLSVGDAAESLAPLDRRCYGENKCKTNPLSSSCPLVCLRRTSNPTDECRCTPVAHDRRAGFRLASTASGLCPSVSSRRATNRSLLPAAVACVGAVYHMVRLVRTSSACHTGRKKVDVVPGLVFENTFLDSSLQNVLLCINTRRRQQ